MTSTIIGLLIGVAIYTLAVKFLVGIWPWEIHLPPSNRGAYHDDEH